MKKLALKLRVKSIFNNSLDSKLESNSRIDSALNYIKRKAFEAGSEDILSLDNCQFSYSHIDFTIDKEGNRYIEITSDSVTDTLYYYIIEKYRRNSIIHAFCSNCNCKHLIMECYIDSYDTTNIGDRKNKGQCYKYKITLYMDYTIDRINLYNLLCRKHLNYIIDFDFRGSSFTQLSLLSGNIEKPEFLDNCKVSFIATYNVKFDNYSGDADVSVFNDSYESSPIGGYKNIQMVCNLIEDNKDSILNKDYSRKVPTKSGDCHSQLFTINKINQFRLLLKIDTLHYESADPINVENFKYEDQCYLKDRIDSVKKRDSCITLTNFKNVITGTFGIDYIDFKNKTISVIIKAPYKDTGEFTTYLFGSSTSIPDLHVFVSFTDENFKLTADLISCRLLKETEEKKMFEYIISIDPKSDKDKGLLQYIVDDDISNYRIVLGPKEYIISQDNTVKKLYEANGCYNLIISSDKTIGQVNGWPSLIRFYPSRFVTFQEVINANVTIVNRYIDTDEKEGKKKYKYMLFFNCYWTNESDFLERIIDRNLKEFYIEVGSDKKSFKITSDSTINNLHKVGCLDSGYTVYSIYFISEEDIEPKYRTVSTISYLPSPVAVTVKESFTTSIARIEYVDVDEYKKEENKVKIADYKPIVAYKLTLHPSAEYSIELLKDAVRRGTNFSIHRKDVNIIINCNKDRILKPMYKKLDHSYELFIKADVILSDGSNNLNDMECEITLYNDDNVIGHIKYILIDAEPIYDYLDIVSLDTKSGDHFSSDIHYDGNELYTFGSDGSKIALCSVHSTIDDMSTKTIDNNTNNEEEKKDMETEAVKSLSITFKGNANDTMISMNAIKYNPKPGRMDKMIIKLIQDNAKSIIFHEPETKIIWKDGTETTVSCGKEKYDKEYGVVFCVLKKLLGNTSNYYDLIKNLVKLGDKQEKVRAKVKADKEAKKLAKRRERQMKEAQEKDLLDSMVDSDSESNT